MQNSLKDIDKAIEWHETTIKETKEFFDGGDGMSDTLRADLLEQLEACETALAALQYVKERGGFI